MRRTRSSGAWVGIVMTAMFLILLAIFIAQNTAQVSIKFLGFNGHMSLGLTILISATIGLLIAAVPGRSASCSFAELCCGTRRPGSAPAA